MIGLGRWLKLNGLAPIGIGPLGPGIGGQAPLGICTSSDSSSSASGFGTISTNPETGEKKIIIVINKKSDSEPDADDIPDSVPALDDDDLDNATSG